MSDLTEIGAKIDPEQQIRLLADLERLNLYLEINHDSNPVPIELDAFSAFLNKTGITPLAEDSSWIEEFVEKFNANPRDIDEHLLTTGRAPVQGKDAPVTWEVGIEERKLSFSNKETINIYEVTKFINVDKDQVILRLGDTTPGVDGVDIFGEPIPADQGEARPFKEGANVAYSNKHTCVATSNGAVQIKGNIVSVSPVLNVDGDVDFSVGNIDYNGAVFIKGNICDGFSVRADYDVFVGGSIEVASVETGGNLRVSGAILTRGKGTVKVDGLLETGYINNANIVTGGDILVHKSIMDSDITCKGQMIVEGGGVIGGTLRARDTVRAGVLGSKMSARTKIIVGPLYNQGESNIIDKNLKEIDEKTKKLKRTLKPFKENPALIERLPQDRRMILENITAELAKLEGEKEKIQAEEVSAETDDAPNEIIVTRTIFPNVEVQIGYSSRLFNDEISGPVILTANETAATIAVSGSIS